MKIISISYRNFRNLNNGGILPVDGINVICGNNAQGKTNLLEAIWLFTGGHSFRGNKDSELINLIKKDQPASLTAEFESGGRLQKAVLNIDRGKRSSIINGIEKKNRFGINRQGMRCDIFSRTSAAC